MPEIEYDYWDVDECAAYYGIKVSNEVARSLYDSIVISKVFLKKPNIESYLCLLNSHFEKQQKRRIKVRTSERRRNLVSAFTAMIDSIVSISNNPHKSLMANEFPELTGKTGQEQIQIVKDGVDDLGKEEILRLTKDVGDKLILCINAYGKILSEHTERGD